MTAPVQPSGQATPGRQPPARAITVGLAATVMVALAGLVLTALEWSSLATSDAVGDIGAVAGSIAYAALGALIVRRAGNFVGWFMLAEGAANAVMITGSAYAIFGMKAHPGSAPGGGRGRGAGRGGLRARRHRPGRALPGLPDRAAALAPVASAGPGRPGADRPEPGLVRGQHAASGAARAGRHLARLSQPAGGPVPPAGHLARHPERPGLAVPAAAGGCASLAGAAVPPRQPAAAPADEVARASHRRSAGHQVVGGLAIAFGRPASRCSKCRTPSPRSWCCSPSRWP